MVKYYRKKPIAIRAIQWTGNNLEECKEFLGEDFLTDTLKVYSDGEVAQHWINIKTLEGHHIASKGDFLIEGVHGEHYPCKPNIFKETYEEVQ